MDRKSSNTWSAPVSLHSLGGYNYTRVSWYRKKHSSTHIYHDHQSSFISFFHLLKTIASSLFNLRVWQSFCTTSVQVLFGLSFGLSFGLAPSTSYFIHFFTQSLSFFAMHKVILINLINYFAPLRLQSIVINLSVCICSSVQMHNSNTAQLNFIIFCILPMAVAQSSSDSVVMHYVLLVLQMTSCFHTMPSVLWCCCLGGRKGIQLVKYCLVGCWYGYVNNKLYVTGKRRKCHNPYRRIGKIMISVFYAWYIYLISVAANYNWMLGFVHCVWH